MFHVWHLAIELLMNRMLKLWLFSLMVNRIRVLLFMFMLLLMLQIVLLNNSL